jgi:signal recognition particle subunit SRP54
MTPDERSRPEIMNARRRQRVARGSGSTVPEVNDLLTRFDQMRRMMKQMTNPRAMKGLMAQAKKSGFKMPR